MTIIEVKNLLNLKIDKYDYYLSEMLQLMIDFVQDECRQSFQQADGSYELPSGVKVFIVKAIEYNMNPAGVTSDSLGDQRLSYSTDFPESILRMLKPYKKARFV